MISDLYVCSFQLLTKLVIAMPGCGFSSVDCCYCILYICCVCAACTYMGGQKHIHTFFLTL